MSKIYATRLFCSTLALSALLSLVPTQAHNGKECCSHAKAETEEGVATVNAETEGVAQAWYQRRSTQVAAASTFLIAAVGLATYRMNASNKALATKALADAAPKATEGVAIKDLVETAEQVGRAVQLFAEQATTQADQSAYFGAAHTETGFVTAVKNNPRWNQVAAELGQVAGACARASKGNPHQLNAQVTPELSDHLAASPSRSYHCPYMALRFTIIKDVMSTCPPVKYVSDLAVSVSQNASELAAKAGKSASDLATIVGEKIKEFRR